MQFCKLFINSKAKTHKLKVLTFGKQCTKAYEMAEFSEDWAKVHSEILKLLKVAEVKPFSTSEVERVFSTLKRLLSKDRTLMSTDHVEACAMVSHESRIRYGSENKFKIAELLDIEINSVNYFKSLI